MASQCTSLDLDDLSENVEEKQTVERSIYFTHT